MKIYKFKINDKCIEIELKPKDYNYFKDIGFENGIEKMINNYILLIYNKKPEIVDLLLDITTEALLEKQKREMIEC